MRTLNTTRKIILCSLLPGFDNTRIKLYLSLASTPVNLQDLRSFDIRYQRPLKGRLAATQKYKRKRVRAASLVAVYAKLFVVRNKEFQPIFSLDAQQAYALLPHSKFVTNLNSTTYKKYTQV